MVLNQDFRLTENHKIVINLSNTLQEDILANFRIEILDFLRTKLNNGKIMLETEHVQEESKKRLYTNTDKFDHLMTKKPELRELKDRLGLDPEF
ncbi:MAG: hypothetical protein AAFX87_04150 [Bacteroidota bacterium]